MRIAILSRTILTLIALPCIVTAPNDAKSAQATAHTPVTIVRTELERSDVPGTNLETRLYLIVYPPGASAPVHHHPVEGIGYIIEGKARSAFGSDAPVTLVAGQSFHDRAMIPHTVFANADTQRPLTFVVAYTVEKGAPVIETP